MEAGCSCAAVHAFLSLQDICKPDAIRLRRNLSAIINFAKFREEKLVPYAEMQEQTIALLEETETLEETNKGLVSHAPLGSHDVQSPEMYALQRVCAGNFISHV